MPPHVAIRLVGSDPSPTELSRQMQALADTVAREMGEMSERMTQIEGRMRLHDRRFDRMLEAVHTALGDTVRRGELLELMSRLEVLERKVDPAA